jgi:hypothetical protein
MKFLQPISNRVKAFFINHFGWLTNIKHNTSPMECERMEKFHEIDERLRLTNEKIDGILATFNGDTDWFMHITREKGKGGTNATN